MRSRAGRTAVAFAVGEAAVVHRGRAYTVEIEQDLYAEGSTEEAWTAAWESLLRAAQLKHPSVVVSLTAYTAPLRAFRDPPESKDWAAVAAAELVPESDRVFVWGAAHRGRGPRWVAAAPRNVILRLLAAATSSGVRVEAVEPSAGSLLRLAPPSPTMVVVAATSRNGAEIVGGWGGIPVLSRYVRSRRAEDAAAEVELTVKYLEREWEQRPAPVIAGPLSSSVAAALRAAGIEGVSTIEVGSLSEAIALGASRAARRPPDLARALRGPGFGVARLLALGSVAVLALSASHALSRRELVERLSSELVALRSEREALRAQLARWEGPKAQAARTALRMLEARAAALDPLDQLRTMVPEDLWVERIEITGTSVRIDGRSISRDSVIRFARNAQAVWSSVALRLAEREENPATSYRFTLEAQAARPSAGARGPGSPSWTPMPKPGADVPAEVGR